MPENICPICQRPNDANADRCWYCQADLSQNLPSKPNNGTDWLNGLREESEQLSEPVKSEPINEAEKPEEIPDWLARIRTREQMEREAQAIKKTESQADLQPVEEKKEELPDWLKEIKAGYSGKKSEADQNKDQTESVSPFASSLPIDQKPAASNQDQSDDTDEWLSKLAAWKPTEEDIEPSNEAVIPEQSGAQESTESKPEPNNGVSQFDLDSLAALHQSEFRPFEVNRGHGWQKLEIDEPKSEQESDLPENQQTSDEVAPTPEEILPKSNFDINALRETIAVQQSNPDFFIKNNTLEEEKDEEVFSDEDIEDFDYPGVTKTEIPSINSAVFTDSQAEIEEDNLKLPPFMPDDLPDWLASVKLDKIEKQADAPVSGQMDTDLSEPEIQKASLPEWLKAARTPAPEISKTENVQPARTDEEGLLAGISGTLQTPGFSGDIKKPVGYGSTIKVSERQKHSANIFSNLIDENLDIEEVEISKKIKNSRIILRLVLTVAFFFFIFLSKNLLAPYVIQPALFPPEVVSIFDQVNSIPADKPVLLTGDFEAAVSGELSWSSQSLLEHLMRRNLRLVILSSNPSGSTMMNQLIEKASKNVAGYDLASHVINLGYLPGGSTGVQLLSGDPRTAMPYTHDLDAAWNSEILNSVNSLSDFGALIILSDKFESSRAWVEQIQPGLGNVPLMFVASAQTAPLLQPYYQSGQVSGYVAGFYGSLAYEQMLQQSDGVSVHLGAFQSAMILAAFLILVGGLVTLIRPATPEHKG